MMADEKIAEIFRRS